MLCVTLGSNRRRRDLERFEAYLNLGQRVVRTREFVEAQNDWLVVVLSIVLMVAAVAVDGLIDDVVVVVLMMIAAAVGVVVAGLMSADQNLKNKIELFF